MKKKKKILIVENLMHFWQVDDLFKIFSKNFECHVLLPKKFRYISKLKRNVITSSLRYLMYLRVILIGKKYDYIYLCSSPEYPDYPNNLKSFIIYFQQLIFFLILIVFYKKKIICYVRGLHRIFPDVHKSFLIKSYIYPRYLLFRSLNYFACENKNLTNIFRKKFKKNFFKITTIYTRYFDKRLSYKKKNNKNFVIGVLGGIDSSRKNYNLLYKSLLNFKKEIKIIFLGKFDKNLSGDVIKNFNTFRIEFKKKTLTEKDFLNFGKKCDILISLNRREKLYGRYKGTGSFGDAMYLQKPLIAPLFADPINEFKDFTFYYKNSVDLNSLIKKILKKNTILKPNFKKFEISYSTKRIVDDLRL
ncbi:hypothetical protein IDH08_01905 [Pelagibacterales bacterium SAG-MED22]|nr:hypothetical protein [Pelagibacterales bacterium SAG-MED22]